MLVDALFIHQLFLSCSTALFIKNLCLWIQLFIKSWKGEKTELSLKRNGMATTGSIIKHYFYTEALPCIVVYRYEYEEKSYECNQIVHLSDFNNVIDGNSVPVICLPDDPKIATLDQIGKSRRTSYVIRNAAWKCFGKAFFELVIALLMLAIIYNKI